MHAMNIIRELEHGTDRKAATHKRKDYIVRYCQIEYLTESCCIHVIRCVSCITRRR